MRGGSAEFSFDVVLSEVEYAVQPFFCVEVVYHPAKGAEREGVIDDVLHYRDAVLFLKYMLVAPEAFSAVFGVPLILELHKSKPSGLARDPGLGDGAELLEGLLDVLVVDAAFLADLGASLRTRTVSRLHQRRAEARFGGKLSPHDVDLVRRTAVAAMAAAPAAAAAVVTHDKVAKRTRQPRPPKSG